MDNSKYNKFLRISRVPLKAEYLNFAFCTLHFDFRLRRGANGYAAITTTFMVLVVSLLIIGGFSAFTLREVKITRAFLRSVEARYIAEAGIEDGLYRVLTGKQIVSGELLLVGGGATTIIYTISGQTRTIRSEGKREAFQQNLETRLDITLTNTNFFYGAQVGDLGLTMGNNSSVVGNVYSDGDIIGGEGAAITGEALVAAGTPETIDQSWEIQNTDVAVGRVSGSIVTVVDQAGLVGEYNSLALGSDGLARLSYYDETNGDLKYARCLNENCTARNITVIDSANDVGWRYTSIKIGSDGFARISYYDASGKDLKFARCLNEDCTSKNITVVESAGDKGQFSSLVLGADDFARISYYAISGGDLKFVRCTNADCSSKNITSVDTSGDVGKYTSVVLGSDGWARISYLHETNDDLKFARCLNADCTSANITTVDSSGDVGSLKTSVSLGPDGLARISYFDDTNDDLKLARCTNDNCTTKVITAVDAPGNVGKYSSLAMHSDGFARVSYYGAGDLRYARCTNADCTAKVTNDPDDTSADLGHYTSLALGSDGFARMAHYDNTNADLRYVRCSEEDCLPSDPQADVAQSFQPTINDRITRVDLFLKKVGNPADATLRIIRSSGGSPSTNPADVLAAGALNASSVSTGYGWVNVALTSTPTLTANTTYWVVIDASADNDNYFYWRGDSGAGYARGSAKKTADWTLGGWQDMQEDLNFRVYMGGTDHMLRDVTINGNAHAHVIDNTSDRTIGGNADGWTLNNITVGENVNANAISNCTVNGDAAYNSMTNCIILGSQTTPNTPPDDPPQIPLPIPQSVIDDWKNEAASGGTCAPPECRLNGDYDPTACNISLGSKKINGNMILDASCSGGQTLTITGNIWVTGNIDISNNAKIRLSAGYGTASGIILSDGWIHISNNGQFSGSGTAGSYIMLLSTATGDGHYESAIDLHNNATGAIFYAQNGLVWLHNNVEVTEVVGRGLHLDNNATLIYEIGLQDVKFSSGPSGGYDVKYWKEVE